MSHQNMRHPVRRRIHFRYCVLASSLSLVVPPLAVTRPVVGNGLLRRLFHHHRCGPCVSDPNRMPPELAALLTPDVPAEIKKVLEDKKRSAEQADQAAKDKQARIGPERIGPQAAFGNANTDPRTAET